MTEDLREAALAHVNRAWNWFSGMVALSATNLGIELGIFDLLREREALTPPEIATALGLVPRAVDLWAKTLLHDDLLTDAGDGRVAMAPGLDLMVCEPVTLFNLAPSLEYHARFLARDFLDLAAFFRDGTPRPPSRHGAALSANVARQTAMMHAVFIEAILPDLPEIAGLFLHGCRVLDAGCGTGDLGVLLATEFPELRYVGYDPDEQAIARGRTVIAERGLGDRVELVREDLAEVSPDTSFDLALLFLALHEIALESRAAVAATLRRAVEPGGILLVLDETYPETLAEAASSDSRMGLHFEYCELLWGSHVPTRAEVEALLEEAGFSGIERLAMLGGSFEIVMARAE